MSRPLLVRYAGLAGSLLLAVSAYLGGARSPWQPTMTPRTILAGENGLLLPLAWLAGTALLIGAWWAGRHVVPSLRWVSVTVALWAVPLLVVLPLGSYDVYSYACQGWALAHGQDPYAAGATALGCPWTDAVSPTWRAAPAPYGPVYLILAAAAAAVGGTLTGTVAALRVIAVLGVVLIAVCVPLLARRQGVDPGRAAWLVLACPLVGVHLISGAHNDAVMAGLLVAALVLARRNLAVAGVVIGLAIGVKATAVVVLPFLVLIAVGPGAAWRALVRPAAVLIGASAAVLAVVSLGAGLGFGWITNLSDSGASVQWTSPPTALGMTIELVTGLHAVPVIRILGIVALAVVLIVLWWRARGQDPSVYAGYALAATVVLAPVFHPWYALWPLAVLAACLHRDPRWLVAPCAVAAALCLPDGYNLALAVKSQGAIAMTVLVVVLAVAYARRSRTAVTPA